VVNAFSENLMDHFMHPRNGGALDDPDAVGTAGVPHQGNYMVLQAKIADGRFAEVRFQCHGCGPTIACGSYLTTLMVGHTPEECLAITEQDLTEYLDVPPHKEASDLVQKGRVGGCVEVMGHERLEEAES